MHVDDEVSPVDPHTGLPNRAGWEAVLEAEEQRVRRHGGRHGLVLVRLGGPPAGRVVEAAARAIAGAIREIDLLARIDQRAFAVLALHCDDLPQLVVRLHAALSAAAIPRDVLVEAHPAGEHLRAIWAVMAAGEKDTRASQPVDFVASSKPCPN